MNQMKWHLLRRPYQKQSRVLRKGYSYYQEMKPKLRKHGTKT